MRTTYATEKALHDDLRTLLANGYRVSQQDAYGGVFAFALVHNPKTGDQKHLEWDAK